MSYLVGNIIRSTATFVPLAGNTTLANISARAIGPNEVAQALTVVQDGTDVYHADVPIADDAIAGQWYVRWESSAPQISLEDKFKVKASAFPQP